MVEVEHLHMTMRRNQKQSNGVIASADRGIFITKLIARSESFALVQNGGPKR